MKKGTGLFLFGLLWAALVILPYCLMSSDRFGIDLPFPPNTLRGQLEIGLSLVALTMLLAGWIVPLVAGIMRMLKDD